MTLAPTDPFARARRIAETILYEGYVLFPYRASALKNRVRTSFGELAPRGSARRSAAVVDALVTAEAGARLYVEVAFLQPVRRTVRAPDGAEVSQLSTTSGPWVPWEEAREQRFRFGPVALGDLAPHAELRLPFVAASDEATRPVSDGGAVVGSVTRTARELHGSLCLSVGERGRPGAPFALRFTLAHDAAVGAVGAEDPLTTMHAAHVALAIESGAFVSVIDPPASAAALAAACESDGLWPFMVGPPGDTSVVLLSPIIVYDHPELAPESPGDLFDATENDELLTLAISSFTDAERAAMRATDPRAASILARTDALGERLATLHGAVRELRVQARRGFVGAGDAVRVFPLGDEALDVAMSGKTGRVLELATEVAGRVHVVVVLDDDPGSDLGRASWGLGHRFFLSPSEVERLGPDAGTA